MSVVRGWQLRFQAVHPRAPFHVTPPNPWGPRYTDKQLQFLLPRLTMCMLHKPIMFQYMVTCHDMANVKYCSEQWLNLLADKRNKMNSNLDNHWHVSLRSSQTVKAETFEISQVDLFHCGEQEPFCVLESDGHRQSSPGPYSLGSVPQYWSAMVLTHGF